MLYCICLTFQLESKWGNQLVNAMMKIGVRDWWTLLFKSIPKITIFVLLLLFFESCCHSKRVWHRNFVIRKKRICFQCSFFAKRSWRKWFYIFPLSPCIYVCMNVCVYECVCVYVCMNVCVCFFHAWLFYYTVDSLNLTHLIVANQIMFSLGQVSFYALYLVSCY